MVFCIRALSRSFWMTTAGRRDAPAPDENGYTAKTVIASMDVHHSSLRPFFVLVVIGHTGRLPVVAERFVNQWVRPFNVHGRLDGCRIGQRACSNGDFPFSDGHFEPVVESCLGKLPAVDPYTPLDSQYGSFAHDAECQVSGGEFGVPDSHLPSLAVLPVPGKRVARATLRLHGAPVWLRAKGVPPGNRP